MSESLRECRCRRGRRRRPRGWERRLGTEDLGDDFREERDTSEGAEQGEDDVGSTAVHIGEGTHGDGT